MAKLQPIQALVLMLMTALLFAACDDYNIVEPRFYTGGDITMTESADGAMQIAVAVNVSGYGRVCILGSAGNVVSILADKYLNAGYNYFFWDKMRDGTKVDRGIYCISVKVEGNPHSLKWFEIK